MRAVARTLGGTTLVGADWHFGHNKVVDKGHRKFGFEYEICGELAEKAGPLTDLVFLGDFCFGQDALWHERAMKVLSLCACKTLVLGNHDKKTRSWYLSHGWDVVCTGIMINRWGSNIYLSHKPLADTRHVDLNVHGHLHNIGHRTEDHQKIRSDKHILVESETKPYLYNLETLIKKKQQEMRDAKFSYEI